MSIDKIENIQKVANMLDSSQDLADTQQQQIVPNKEHFDAAMNNDFSINKGQALVEIKPQTIEPIQANSASLLDHIRDANYKNNGAQVSKVTPEGMRVTTDELVSKIKDLKSTLSAPNVSIKSSAQMHLHNKLSHINDGLNIALSKAGVEVNGADLSSQRVNPVARFLDFLTDGQNKLENLGSELKTMGEKKISPVAMMTIQIKVGQIQQELELFTNLLNKSLESIKTIMNVQI